jgi:2,4-dienoyl-CoA reductase-like NADH-dependent reductase (Old Yellow Enzyme family)
MEKYNQLKSAFAFPVSGVVAQNRIVMAPMTTFSGNPDGTVSDQELAYYKRRAKGIGTLVTACAYVTPEGKGFFGQIGAHTDEMIPSLTKLAATIKSEGALAILQIYHGGRMSPPSEVPNGEVLSASNVPAEREGAPIPRSMTHEEVLATIDAYAQATRRAIVAGFDGVEIHGANTYLIQQFFSPHSNRRNDMWGGDLAARMQLPLAVVDAVKNVIAEHASRQFVVGYRLSPEEVETPGITISDTLELADKLSSKQLDYLHVSTMDFWSGSIRDQQDQASRAVLISKRVGAKVPIVGVGSVRTFDDAARIVEAGIPLVAVGRELIVEPDWAVKLYEGNEAVRVALPLGAKSELAIPDAMWNAIVSRPGWFPVEE